jgi:MFS family permease
MDDEEMERLSGEDEKDIKSSNVSSKADYE